MKISFKTDLVTKTVSLEWHVDTEFNLDMLVKFSGCIAILSKFLPI